MHIRWATDVYLVQHLDEVRGEGIVNEAVQQVAFADKILLNKIDLVDATEKSNVQLSCISSFSLVASSLPFGSQPLQIVRKYVLTCLVAPSPGEEVPALHQLDSQDH